MNDILRGVDLTRIEQLDLSDAIITENPIETPLLSLLYANNRVQTAKSNIERMKVKKLSKDDYSGGRVDGSLAPTAEKTSYDFVENYLETFEKSAKVADSAASFFSKDKNALLLQAIQDRTEEIKEDIEKAMINGVIKKTINIETETGTKMNGLMRQAEHIIDLEGAAITKKDISHAMKILRLNQARGQRYILANPDTIEDVLDIYTKAENSRITLAPGIKEIGFDAKRIRTPFGTAELVDDIHVPSGELLFFAINDVEIRSEAMLQYNKLGKLGSFEGGLIRSHLTILGNPYTLAVVKNFNALEEDNTGV